jgi:peptidoglycan/xylan/chitin deacetylase (PgdA/CDA1 family)
VSTLRRLAFDVLRVPTLNQALRVLAHTRGRRLVLVYHRVEPAVTRALEIIPSVPVEVFRAQLELLREVVDFVTLDELIGWRTPRAQTAGAARRPAVAVTFDDDLRSHVEHALPVLRALKVPATFFLSGRVVNGQSAYWFQQLEALLEAHGPGHTASVLGVPDIAWNSAFMYRCERDSSLRRRIAEASADLPGCEVLDRAGMATLAAAGMAIGFHTVSHRILPDLDDAAIDEAVTRGRAELAAATGAPIEYFAYPYGRFDSRAADAVRRAGFRAAFTGQPVAVQRGDDVYSLGRWEPGLTAGDDLLAKLTVRLHRGASGTVHGL